LYHPEKSVDEDLPCSPDDVFCTQMNVRPDLKESCQKTDNKFGIVIS
jgi:hypothetical protein